MLLSPVHLLIFTSVLLAVGLTVALVGKRRQEHAFGEFSDQLRRLTSASSAAERIDLEGKPESLERLASAVNQLLESLEQRGADLHGREQLFQRLVEPCIMRCWFTANGFCSRIRDSWLFWD